VGTVGAAYHDGHIDRLFPTQRSALTETEALRTLQERTRKQVAQIV